MRRTTSAWRATLMVAATMLWGLLPPTVNAASAAPACPDPASPEMAPSLIDLQQALGAVMGSPLSCPQIDADGTIVQVTTTGLAVYRPNGMSVFASGKQHWALTAQGLETWTGNWHNGLYPPVIAPPLEDQSGFDQRAPASVQAVTVVRVPRADSSAVVVEDSEGTMFAVETASGCPDLVATPGERLFIRSDGPYADLIFLQQHETCSVAEMYAAAGD
jgi:hypothetical protein